MQLNLDQYLPLILLGVLFGVVIGIITSDFCMSPNMNKKNIIQVCNFKGDRTEGFNTEFSEILQYYLPECHLVAHIKDIELWKMDEKELKKYKKILIEWAEKQKRIKAELIAEGKVSHPY
jgi:hypothetical protein